jgi:hypothetical protein
MAPAIQTLIFGLRLCLPAAPVLPVGDNEKFGTILVLWAALGQAERLACAAKVPRSRTTRQPRAVAICCGCSRQELTLSVDCCNAEQCPESEANRTLDNKPQSTLLTDAVEKVTALEL